MDAMRAGMTAAEYTSWLAYFSIEPFPETRADIRTAEIVRALLWLGGRKRAPALAELIPDYWKAGQARAQTPAEIHSALTLALAGARKKKPNVPRRPSNSDQL